MLTLIILIPAVTLTTSTRCNYQRHRFIELVHLQKNKYKFVLSIFPTTDKANHTKAHNSPETQRYPHHLHLLCM
jgi:hypothetical protein